MSGRRAVAANGTGLPGPARLATARVACGGRELVLAELAAPLPLAELVPGDEPWEVELGFGRGSYLVHRAEQGGVRLLGVEVAQEYYRILCRRARSRGLSRLVVVRAEAQFAMSVLLPGGFARAVHVYFPDPWPKSRHHKRRLFEPESVDLVLRLLAPGGRLLFATDHLDYGVVVREILAGHPALVVREHPLPWPDGARTNYEAKYIGEGRPILRLEAELLAGTDLLHPLGRAGVLAAVGAADRG